jgi:hypothetical protein
MENSDQTPASILSSTQVGKIAENIVAAQLMIASNGRLSPFTPLADDDGTDLVVLDKLTGKHSRIQIKCRRATRKDPPGYIQFDVRRQTFSVSADNYVLAVLMDPDDGSIWRAWFIPAMDIPGASISRESKFSITPNPSLTSSDRYTDWRCEGLGDVARILTEAA